MPTPNAITEQHYFDPTILNQEATKSATLDLLSTLSRTTKSRGSTGRPRGRPLGSKNKPKIDPLTGQLSGGPKPKADQQPSTVEELKKRNAAKKKRAEELEARILEEGNEALMSMFIGLGVPAQMLYLKPPPIKVVNSNYTPWANRIAIKEGTAKVLSLTAAEWESSNAAAQIAVNVMKDSPLRLAVLSIASVFMVGRQVKAVIDLQNELKPWIEAYKKAQQTPQPAQQEEATVNQAFGGLR